MDVVEIVKLVLVARLLIAGTRAWGSTAAAAAVNTNSQRLQQQDTASASTATESEKLHCYDWDGNEVEDGKQFTPDKLDPCMTCTCVKGKRTMCAAVRCMPPVCSMWEQVHGECCKFHCIRPEEPGMNNKNSSTFIRGTPDDGRPANADDDTTNLGLRLVASTVTSFLILALLLFMIHRLRRRRMLLMMRRLSSNNRRENGSDVVAAAYVSEYDDINIGVEIPPYEDPPPPYSPPRPPRNLPVEAPPPYETVPRASPGDVSEIGFRNVQSQTQDTMMRTSASQMRILDHGDRPNDNAHLGQVDNNNVHGAHDMNQNPIADVNQNRISNMNNTNGATHRSIMVRLPETGSNREFERLRRSEAARSNREEHNYENLDSLRRISLPEPMYANIDSVHRSLIGGIPGDAEHERNNRNVERHSCYIDRERGRVWYERTRGRGSSSDTESNHSRRGGYDTVDNPMSTDSSRASSMHQSFCSPVPQSVDVSPNLPLPNNTAGDGIEDERDATRQRPGDPRTSFLKRSGEMEVRRLRDSPRNSFCFDDNTDLDEINECPINVTVTASPVDSTTKSTRNSYCGSLDRSHRRPCYQSACRTSKIVLEDNEDRKIVWSSQDSASNVSERSVQTQSEPCVQEDRDVHYLTVPVRATLPKSEPEQQQCGQTPRFRISKFLDAPFSNFRHSTYAAQPPSPRSNQNKTQGMHRRSLPPMSLSLGVMESQLCAGHQRPEQQRGNIHPPQLHDNDSEHNYNNYQKKLSRLKPDTAFSPTASPDVYPGSTHFSSPLTPVQSSSCNSPNHYCQGGTPIQSPITPGTPVHPLQRSNSLLSQASFLSICSETGEKRKRKHHSHHYDGLSSPGWIGSYRAHRSASRGNPRKYPSMGSVLPPSLSCECDEESVENFQNCRLHNTDRQKAISSYSVHSCPEELPKEESLPVCVHGGARPKAACNYRHSQKLGSRDTRATNSPENMNQVKQSCSPEERVDNVGQTDPNAMDDNGNPALPEKRPVEDNFKASDSPDRYRKVRRRDILVDPSTTFKQYGFIDSPELFSAIEQNAAFRIDYIPDISQQTKSKSTGSVATKSNDLGETKHSQSTERGDASKKHERSHSAERAPVRWVPGHSRRPHSMAEHSRPSITPSFSWRRTRRNSYRRRSARRKSRQSVSFDQPDSSGHGRVSTNPISNQRGRSLERNSAPRVKRDESPATMVIRPGRDFGANRDPRGKDQCGMGDTPSV